MVMLSACEELETPERTRLKRTRLKRTRLKRTSLKRTSSSPVWSVLAHGHGSPRPNPERAAALGAGGGAGQAHVHAAPGDGGRKVARALEVAAARSPCTRTRTPDILGYEHKWLENGYNECFVTEERLVHRGPSLFYGLMHKSYNTKEDPAVECIDNVQRRDEEKKERGGNELPNCERAEKRLVADGEYSRRRWPLQLGWTPPPLTQKSTWPTCASSPSAPALVWITCTTWASSRVSRNDVDPKRSTSGRAGSSPATRGAHTRGYQGTNENNQLVEIPLIPGTLEHHSMNVGEVVGHHAADVRAQAVAHAVRLLGERAVEREVRVELRGALRHQPRVAERGQVLNPSIRKSNSGLEEPESPSLFTAAQNTGGIPGRENTCDFKATWEDQMCMLNLDTLQQKGQVNVFAFEAAPISASRNPRRLSRSSRPIDPVTTASRCSPSHRSFPRRQILSLCPLPPFPYIPNSTITIATRGTLQLDSKIPPPLRSPAPHVYYRHHSLLLLSSSTFPFPSPSSSSSPTRCHPEEPLAPAERAPPRAAGMVRRFLRARWPHPGKEPAQAVRETGDGLYEEENVESSVTKMGTWEQNGDKMAKISATEERIHIMEKAYDITRNIYKKKCLSRNSARRRKLRNAPQAPRECSAYRGRRRRYSRAAARPKGKAAVTLTSGARLTRRQTRDNVDGSIRQRVSGRCSAKRVTFAVSSGSSLWHEEDFPFVRAGGRCHSISLVFSPWGLPLFNSDAYIRRPNGNFESLFIYILFQNAATSPAKDTLVSPAEKPYGRLCSESCEENVEEMNYIIADNNVVILNEKNSIEDLTGLESKSPRACNRRRFSGANAPEGTDREMNSESDAMDDIDLNILAERP
ncbi:Protein of unknown function [Gryllus bimaculatus]|nr:Protein of unknown function [Gryllus bimaculatus]